MSSRTYVVLLSASLCLSACAVKHHPQNSSAPQRKDVRLVSDAERSWRSPTLKLSAMKSALTPARKIEQIELKQPQPIILAENAYSAAIATKGAAHSVNDGTSAWRVGDNPQTAIRTVSKGTIGSKAADSTSAEKVAPEPQKIGTTEAAGLAGDTQHAFLPAEQPKNLLNPPAAYPTANAAPKLPLDNWRVESTRAEDVAAQVPSVTEMKKAEPVELAKVEQPLGNDARFRMQSGEQNTLGAFEQTSKTTTAAVAPRANVPRTQDTRSLASALTNETKGIQPRAVDTVPLVSSTEAAAKLPMKTGLSTGAFILLAGGSAIVLILIGAILGYRYQISRHTTPTRRRR
ncbi:MAG: hypothetical protein IT290_06690 [Deltaproteobacteria bacterium]|nr:hypothetical protein [Deltaproteobacteria bacterium]